MLKFLKAEDGAVTLYLAIILVAVFMFNALLIDYTRIMVASKETENAVQAGVRSVLSAYDPSLQAYGLYGVKGSNTDAQEIFKKIVDNSLAGETAEGQYKYISTHITNNGVQLQLPSNGKLSSHAIFEQQILEEMKYKAPVQLTLDLLNQIQKGQVSSDINETSQFMESTDKLNDKVTERENYLTDVLVKNQEILNDLKDVAQKDSEEGQDTEDAQKKRTRSIAKIKTKIRDARGSLDNAHNVDKEIRSLASSVSLGEGYFSTYQLELDSYKLLCSQTTIEQADIDEVEKVLIQRQQSEEARKQKDQISKSEAEQKAKEEAGSSENVDLGKIDDIAGQIEKYTDAQKCFDNLNKLKDKYNLAEEQRKKLDTDKVKASTSALAFAQKLLSGKGLWELFLSARNHVYVNEYALMYFNSYTTVNGDDRYSQLRSKHPIKKEEVEYIIYGLPFANANFIAASGEIFTIRFAIRTAEGYEKFKYLTDPRAIAIAAVTYGAIKAADDERRLLKGEKVEMAAKFKNKIMLSYQDYMRLFMLQADNDRKLSRMQALLDLDTGSDLTQRPAYIIGSATTGLKLWFLPGIAQSLGKAQNGAYQIHKKAAMYY